jgi:hypothetical protein
VTFKILVALVLLLSVVCEAGICPGQQFAGAIPIFLEAEDSNSLIDWGNIAPRLRSHMKVSVLFPRWKISAKLLPHSGSEMSPFSFPGWIRQPFFFVSAPKQELYSRNGVLRI